MESVEKEKSHSIRTKLLISHFKKHKSASANGSIDTHSDLDMYFNKVCENDIDDFDILKW